MPRSRPPANWAPTIFDDHGQPLCETPEEEQQIYDDHKKLGPDWMAVADAVQHTILTLATNWDINPADRPAHAVLAIRIAEQAHRNAISTLSEIVGETHPEDWLYHHIADRTGISTDHLIATYPITSEPPF